jgi:hypothetical protein
MPSGTGMSGRDWALGAAFAGLLVAGVVSLLGPFRLDDDERAEAQAGSAPVRAWLAGWPGRPRAPVAAGDWDPRGGRLFLPSLAAAALTYGGVSVLLGHGQTFRTGGAVALGAGVLLGVLLVGYFRRPKWPESLGEMFKISRPGYRADEVDPFFATLAERSVGELKRATFRMASAGYDVDLVDDAIAARLSESRSAH